MISYKHWLLEKRRNPEQNPKVSSYDALRKYFGRSDVYFSMRDINKLGINPNSKYDTPNGIYSYWLNVYEDKLASKKSIEKTVPFAGASPIVYIFKPKKGTNIIKLSEMDEAKTKEFIKMAFEKAPKFKTFFVEDVNELKKLERQKKRLEKIIKILEDDKEDLDEIFVNLSITFYYADEDEKEIFYKIFGFDLLKIKPFNISTIALRIKRLSWSYKRCNDKVLSVYEDTNNKLQEEKERLISNSDIDDMVDKVWNKGKNEAKMMNKPSGIFWWFSWKVGGNPNKWNSFFRMLGVDGVNDDNGDGVIHKNEPFQCVFFDKTKLEVLEVVDNKDIFEGYYFKGKKFNKKIVDGVLMFDSLNLQVMKLNSLKELPWVKEGLEYKVTGEFDCSYNNLTTLEGSPSTVGGYFDCSNNKVKFTEEQVREVCDVEGNIYV